MGNDALVKSGGQAFGKLCGGVRLPTHVHGRDHHGTQHIASHTLAILLNRRRGQKSAKAFTVHDNQSVLQRRWRNSLRRTERRVKKQSDSSLPVKIALATAPPIDSMVVNHCYSFVEASHWQAMSDVH